MESTDKPTSTSSDFFCSVHSNRPFKYICMDLDCIKHPNCCIICVKNNHRSCQDKLILEKNSLKEKLEILTVEGEEMSNFKEDMKKMLQEMHAYMTQKYKKYMSSTLNYLGSDALSEDQILNPETLKNIKNKFNLKIKDDNKISIAPKIDPKDPKLQESIRAYKEDIKNLMDDFSKRLDEIQFVVGSTLKISDFEFHKNIGK